MRPAAGARAGSRHRLLAHLSHRDLARGDAAAALRVSRGGGGARLAPPAVRGGGARTLGIPAVPARGAATGARPPALPLGRGAGTSPARLAAASRHARRLRRSACVFHAAWAARVARPAGAAAAAARRGARRVPRDSAAFACGGVLGRAARAVLSAGGARPRGGALPARGRGRDVGARGGGRSVSLARRRASLHVVGDDRGAFSAACRRG